MEMDVRQYDATIARWTSIDPVTHYDMSTYNAFDNNPIYWADPSGADAEDLINNAWNSTASGSNATFTNNGNGTFSGNNGTTVNSDSSESDSGGGDCPLCQTGKDYANYFGAKAQGAQEAISLLQAGNNPEIRQSTPNYGISRRSIINLNSSSRYGSLASTIWGRVDINLATGTYLTTKGIRKPIWLSNGNVRSARAQFFATQFKLARVGSFGLAGFSTAIDAIGLYNYYANPNDPDAFTVSPTRFALNGTFTAIGIWGGPVGWAASGLYFGGAYLYDTGHLKPGNVPRSKDGQLREDYRMCFVGGTKITLANGLFKNIEDIREGDFIKSFNETTLKVEDKKVLLVETSKSDVFMQIVFEDGTINMNTLSHPYYIKEKGWSSFDKEQTLKNYKLSVNVIRVGDIAYKLNPKTRKVEELKILDIRIVKSEQKTYNISNVESNHNFFANGVLVHNKRSK